MRKTILICLLILTATNLFSQNRYLEFRAGTSFSAPQNSDVAFKINNDYIKTGLNVSAGAGYSIFDDEFRFCGYMSYTSHGEKYKINDTLNFLSQSNWFQLTMLPKYYIRYTPIYIGAGLYCGFAVNNNVEEGDDLISEKTHQFNYPDYYKKFDFGATTVIGAEWGLGNIKFNIEAEYAAGLRNISNRPARTIKNRNAAVMCGLTLYFPDKHYGHF